MAEVIFLVIIAICIVALFAIEGNRAKELNKLESRIVFLQDRLLELATRADVQDALIKIKANDPQRKLLKVTIIFRMFKKYSHRLKYRQLHQLKI